MILFRSERTRQISKKMLGNMKPSEMLELVTDPDVENSDVPEWVELMIETYCTMLVERFDWYEARYTNRYGQVNSLLRKMVYYGSIWVNWDGLEPFPWREERPIKYYFDSNVRNPERRY